MTNGSHTGIVDKNQRVKEDGGDQLFVKKKCHSFIFWETMTHTENELYLFISFKERFPTSHLGFTISFKQFLSYFLFSLEDRSKPKSTTDSTTSNIWQTDDTPCWNFDQICHQTNF